MKGTRMIRRLLVLPLLALLAVLTAAPALADSYADQIAGMISVDHHVIIDGAADPKLPREDELNDQIKFSGVPLWVVNAAHDQTGKFTPQALHDALYATHSPITAPIQVDGKSHNPPLILVVIDGDGYHEFSFDVSQAVADQTKPAMDDAAARHHHDLYGTMSQYVSTMAAIPDAGKPGDVASGSPSNASDVDWGPVGAFFLWVLIIISVLTVVFFVGRLLVDWYGRRQDRRDALDTDISRTQTRVIDLADDVVMGMDVGTHQMNADLALADAREARKHGRLTEAENHVERAKHYLAKADEKMGVKPNPDLSAIKKMTRHRSVPTRTRVTATDAVGKAVDIDNSDFKTRSQKGYRHYYPGGVYNGVDFWPGYYPVCISTCSWNPTDAVEVGSPVHDSWNGDYSREGGATPWATPHHTPTPYAGSSSGGGNTGFGHKSSSSSASGGHSSFGSSHTSSDYSGGSSGGGFSSFGGGFSGGFGGGSSGGGSTGF